VVIDPDALNVWNEQRLVGYLWRNPLGYIGFRYDAEWITTGGFAVSRTLPLRADDFAAEDVTAHRFFANLLPEGGVREHIVRDLKIPDTDFDLLRAIGGECAGALSILPVERSPSEQRYYRPITDEALANLAARRGLVYADWPAHERPRRDHGSALGYVRPAV
jgi:serine/threonine-protein kinase HipA